jgi:hypothetical protein
VTITAKFKRVAGPIRLQSKGTSPSTSCALRRSQSAEADAGEVRTTDQITVGEFLHNAISRPYA